MKVIEAIEILKKLNPNLDMGYLYDGAVREDVNLIYESKGGKVVIADYGLVCYDNEDRPINAPNEEEEKYYSLPEKSK